MARAVSIARNAGTASVVEWAKLALRSPRARVLRVARVRYEAPGSPIAFEEVVLPLDRFPCWQPMVVRFRTSPSWLSTTACRLPRSWNASALSKPPETSRCISGSRLEPT